MTELEYAKAYNAEFSRLNPVVPMNAKWDPIQQMKYIKELLARQQAVGGTGYLFPYISQVTSQPNAPATPAVMPTTPLTPTGNSLVEALTAARYVVKQLEALVNQ